MFACVGDKIGIAPRCERADFDDVRPRIPGDALHGLAAGERRAVQSGDPGVVIFEKRALRPDLAQVAAGIRVALPQLVAVALSLLGERQFRSDGNDRDAVTPFGVADECVRFGK